MNQKKKKNGKLALKILSNFFFLSPPIEILREFYKKESMVFFSSCLDSL